MHSPVADDPWPMQANLGGPVDPGDHIGHGRELDEVLRSTESVGALLTGDRRMGKTSLLRKAEQLLSGEHVVLRMSAETDDIELFGSRLLDALRGHHVFAEELKRWNVLVDVGYKGIRLQRQPDGGPEREEGTDDLSPGPLPGQLRPNSSSSSTRSPCWSQPSSASGQEVRWSSSGACGGPVRSWTT